MANLLTIIARLVDLEGAGNTASVDGQQVARKYFAFVGDPSKPSTWKLPCHDAGHTRDAMARFNQTELPSSARSRVKAFIMRRARHFGIDVKDFANVK